MKPNEPMALPMYYTNLHVIKLDYKSNDWYLILKQLLIKMSVPDIQNSWLNQCDGL